MALDKDALQAPPDQKALLVIGCNLEPVTLFHLKFQTLTARRQLSKFAGELN